MQHDDLDRNPICDAAPTEDDRRMAAYWLAGAERLSNLEPPFRAKNIAICLASAFRKGMAAREGKNG